jgi:hypothetical protein
MEEEEKISKETDYVSEAEALNQLIRTLQNVSPNTRKRLIQTVMTFFHIHGVPNGVVDQRSEPTYEKSSESPWFSNDRSMTPKEFLLEKQPRTDVERVACLAYYLTHYRDTPHFKTIDISKLNTEAAQRKFTNAAKAVSNASRNEYLVTATKGQKQLGAIGEVFVEALPNREDAKSAVNTVRPSRKRTIRKSKVKS